MAARRYEFYFRVVKTIFYERAQRVSKILFPLKHSCLYNKWHYGMVYGACTGVCVYVVHYNIMVQCTN